MSILRDLLHACGLDECRCGACHTPYDTLSSQFLCPSCQSAIGHTRPLCRLCGVPLAVLSFSDLQGETVCGHCLVSPPPWSRLSALGLHEGLLRELLLRAKYKADRGTCRMLGRLLAAKLNQDARPGCSRPELLIPMPLHPARLRQRGLNQCHEIAAPISSLLSIPRCSKLAQRVVATRSQTGLRRNERLRNVRWAFAADVSVRGRRVLVLDDTVTTGTTLRSLTECLLGAGACSVEVAVVAVAAPHTHRP